MGLYRTDVAKVEPRKKARERTEELVEKWKDHLADLGKNDKYNLAVLLDNTNCLNKVEDDSFLTPDQKLWLVKHGWLRTRFRSLINVQATMGPTTLTFPKKHCAAIKSEAVAVSTHAYDFVFFPDTEFEKMKDTYANSIANQLDYFIFDELYERFGCATEVLLDMDAHLPFAKGALKNLCDYLIAPQSTIDALDPAFTEGVTVYATNAVLDGESFHVKSVIGRYPNSRFTPPILVPYLLIGMPTRLPSGLLKTFFRAGWSRGESD